MLRICREQAHRPEASDIAILSRHISTDVALMSGSAPQTNSSPLVNRVYQTEASGVSCRIIRLSPGPGLRLNAHTVMRCLHGPSYLHTRRYTTSKCQGCMSQGAINTCGTQTSGYLNTAR